MIYGLLLLPHSPFREHGYWLLLLSALMEGFFGGWTTVQAGVNAYISDVSVPDAKWVYLSLCFTSNCHYLTHFNQTYLAPNSSRDLPALSMWALPWALTSQRLPSDPNLPVQ
jgi:hypothetical protein